MTRAAHTPLKRTFDLAVCSVALIPALPLSCACAFGAAVDTKSFPLFFQKRLGKNGKEFLMIKIKTMNDKTDANGNPLPEAFRTSTFGRLMRRSRLDELPQLINIIKGDMSLVGPRPATRSESILMNSTRQSIKPGLTGIAQLKCNNQTSQEDVLREDLHYIATRSFLGDLRIILATPAGIIRRAQTEEHFRSHEHKAQELNAQEII